MVHRAVRDALQNDKRYAKAIVSLVKIRTAPVEGLDVDIQSPWNGKEFSDLITLSVRKDQEKLVWSPLDPPRLYKLTLKTLEETFRELQMDPCSVTMQLTVSPQKRPHFQGFVFAESGGVLFPPDGMIQLSHNDWRAEELNDLIRELGKMRKKLKGIGLI